MRIVVHTAATIGLIVTLLDVAGMLGIGNFVIYYGAKPLMCKAVQP